MEFFSRLSTGVKMLIILSTALLPLGVIALFASIDSARTNRLQRDAEARLMATSNARQIDTLFNKVGLILREAANRPDLATPCATARTMMAQSGDVPVRFAYFDAGGARTCATPGFSALPGDAPRTGIGAEVQLIAANHLVRLAVDDGSGGFGLAEIPDTALIVGHASGFPTNYRLTLIQGTSQSLIREHGQDSAFDNRQTATATVGSGQMALQATVQTMSVSQIEILMTLLPLLMWIAAAVIGWLVVERLLLSPLADLQAAIDNYHPERGPLVLPRLTTPAHEIRRLGNTLLTATEEIRRHETELELSLARQRRLTREVHHRVKNNLQVVASLINLHARGVADPAAAAAYASIQRRVDALAVVHRHHFAELEENSGLSLRALISELAVNLRATAPPTASKTSISLDLGPQQASQDVAVAVAFLITEIAELVLQYGKIGLIGVSLRNGQSADRALLTLDVPDVTDRLFEDHPSLHRFSRVVEGLARQLRAPLIEDRHTGHYEIEIAVLS